MSASTTSGSTTLLRAIFLPVFSGASILHEHEEAAMAENSGISWTDDTFNPWIGCTKVSPACDFCYAETWDVKAGGERWGAKAARTGRA